MVVRRLKISRADLECRSGCEKREKNKTVMVMASLLAMILLSLYLPDTLGWFQFFTSCFPTLGLFSCFLPLPGTVSLPLFISLILLFLGIN